MYRYNESDNRELYSDVAELYHQHRPDYPTRLIQRAIELANLKPDSEVLEIGSGPGTATLAFASRAIRMHCVEPSTGMLGVAKRVCQKFDSVSYEQATFEQSAQRPLPYDAVLAASSFHWANDPDSLARVQRSLTSDGSLILFWNLPPEPDVAIRQRIADATGRATPFFFGEYCVEDHCRHIQEQVLSNIAETNWFEPPIFDSETSTRECTAEGYLGFVATLSPYIRLSDADREHFFAAARHVLDECDSPIKTENTCLMHVLRRRRNKNATD